MDEQTKKREAPEPASRPRLGTFAGVFTPSVLTILGLILFLRLGYVVGAAGLPRALLIILLANAISVLTSISLTVTATNLRVKGGGNYYLISRTLGVGFGGSIGLVLFIAQAVSVAFYCIGFSEAMVAMLGLSQPWLPTALAGGTILLLTAFAWLGADWATRFQYVVMLVLVASLVSFFVGGVRAWDQGLLGASVSPGSGTSFWVLFALFFPAVTGFTQGVNMSGDLEDPGRSIPRGTFAAVGLSALIYLGVAVVLAASVPVAALVGDYRAMRGISVVPWLIDAGIVAATLSSAMASYLGAPRILQALATDKVFPPLNAFAKGFGPANNPRRGVVLSGLIALATLLLGDLDAVASVVSMFFLITYGLLNYATYYEARSNSPSFRPRFKWFDQRLSLLGMLGCLGAMLALDPLAATVALTVLFGIFQYVTRRAVANRWADSNRSARLQSTRENLLQLASEVEHTRDWRPVLLAITDDPARRQRLLRFAHWLGGGSGFTTAVRILTGEGPQVRSAREEAEQELKDEIAESGMEAFACAVVAPDRMTAKRVLLQAHGLGPVRANTVLLNWFDGVSDDSDRPLEAFTESLWATQREKRHLLILEASEDEFRRVRDTPVRKRRIDVLYQPDSTGRLMLMFAYLMTRTEDWRKATLRLVAARDAGREEKLQRTELKAMLEDVRIDAEVHLVEKMDERMVVKTCSESSVVFLPARLRGASIVLPLDADVRHLIGVLPMSVLALASQDFELDAEPEEGLQGELASALDDVKRHEETARRYEASAETATEGVRETEKRLAAARAAGKGSPELERVLAEARERAEDEQRRAAKARAKADNARERATELTPRGRIVPEAAGEGPRKLGASERGRGVEAAPSGGEE